MDIIFVYIFLKTNPNNHRGKEAEGKSDRGSHGKARTGKTLKKRERQRQREREKRHVEADGQGGGLEYSEAIRISDPWRLERMIRGREKMEALVIAWLVH